MFRKLSFLIIALCIHLAVTAPANGQRGDTAASADEIRQLKESDEYDSLVAAFKQARYADGIPEPEDIESAIKFYAPDGDSYDVFGGVIARDGDTLAVSAPSAGNGAVYVFVRSGSTWTFQQKLVDATGVSGDLYGTEVSISGNTIAVSLPGAYYPDMGQGVGAVLVFVRSGTTWSQQARIRAPDPQFGDLFGLAMALESNTLVVGSYGIDLTYYQPGEVHIFVRSGTTWTLQQSLYQPVRANVARYGDAVSLSGSSLIVGAYGTETAYVYVRSGTVWSLQQQLTPSDPETEMRFGYDVALDGNTAVITAPYDDIGANEDQGSVYVFVRSGSTWSEQQKLTVADGAASGDSFGRSDVKIRGNTIVASRYSDMAPTPPASRGSTYVFTRTGVTWTQIHKLTPADGFSDDSFGSSVEIDGSKILVGASYALNPGGVNTGAVYLFDVNNEWLEEANKVSPDPGVSDYFGHSVAMNGNTAVIGSWGDTGWRGAAYVFTRSGTTWSFQQKLVASDGASNDNFGKAVSINGATIAIGASSDDIGSNSDQGSAYIFVKSGSLWLQQQKITAADGAASDNFGQSISISGSTVAIGSPHDDNGAAANQGSVYFYLRTGSTWNLQQKITAVDGAAGDQLGFTVSLENNTAVIGAPTDDFPGKTDQGAAYVFGRSGSTWTLRQKLVAPDGAASEQFGYSVALQGPTVVVGAPFDQIGSNVHQGSAYPYYLSGATWIPAAKMIASDGAAFDEFGWSVAVEGADAVIGARGDDIAGRLSQGSAYVFSGLGTIWTQRQQLIAADGLMDDQFGTSVAISGGKIVVGAPFAQVSTYDNAGRAYFYVNYSTLPSPRGVIAGTVKTDRGMPVKNALLTLTDATGNTRQSVTNAFGYYSFEDVPEIGPGEIMVLTVSSKSYAFNQPQRIITAAESGEENWDFISEPPEHGK